jgi:tetratricopeptide (TPR) repeat protein
MFWALLIFIAVFLSGGIYAMIFYSREIILKDGIEYYGKKDYDNAIEKFKTYLTIKHSDVVARIYLYKIYYERKEFIDCIKECIAVSSNLTATSVERAEATAVLAEIYFNQNQTTKAANMVAEGFRNNPKNPKLHYVLGLIYLRAEKISSAIVSLNNVLANDRTNIPARLKLAEIHRNQGDMVKSVFQYKKVIELENFNREARFNLAKIYFNDWDYARAAIELNMIKDMSGIELEYNYMMAKHNIDIKEYEKAKDYLEFLVNEIGTGDDRILEAKYELGKIYQSEGKNQEAFDLYKTIKSSASYQKDIDRRVYELEKILNPSYFTEIMDKINYSSYSIQEIEDLFYKLIEKLGYKEVKILNRGKRGMSVIGVDRFRPAVNEKFYIQLEREIENTDIEKVKEFVNGVKEEKVQFGIMISTEMFTEEAMEFAKEDERLTLLDKVNIYEIMGG